MRKFINRIVALFLSFTMAVQLGAGDIFLVFAQEVNEPAVQSETVLEDSNEQESNVPVQEQLTNSEQTEIPTVSEESTVPVETPVEETPTVPMESDNTDQTEVPEEQNDPQIEQSTDAEEDASQPNEPNDLETQKPNMLMSMMLQAEPLTTVTVSRVDQEGNSLGVAQLPVGEISEKVQEIPLEGYDFVRAQIQSNSGTDTEIKYLATYNGDVYYSTESTNVAGTILTENETIQLVYRSHVEKYTVTYEVYVDGQKQENYQSIISIDGPQEVEEDTSFAFLLKPSKGYTVQNVYQNDKRISSSNENYQSNNVNENTIIKVELDKKDVATISFSGSNTYFKFENGDWENSGPQHQITVRKHEFSTSKNQLVFYLHSYKQYEPGDDAKLNKLTFSCVRFVQL